MQPERIYLVGFMGAGKSRVGRELAAHLRWKFVDMDAEIEKAESLAIRDIFVRFGEPYFRRLESEHLQRLSARSKVVIALGGGAYIDPGNRLRADSTGVTVWLRVEFESAIRRVAIDGTRPLLANLQEARQLFESRQPLYGVAQIHVLTDNRDPAAIANEIAERLERL